MVNLLYSADSGSAILKVYTIDINNRFSTQTQRHVTFVMIHCTDNCFISTVTCLFSHFRQSYPYDGSFKRPKHMLQLMGKRIFTILRSEFVSKPIGPHRHLTCHYIISEIWCGTEGHWPIFRIIITCPNRCRNNVTTGDKRSTLISRLSTINQ